MFLALWHYLKGYVIIKIVGFSTERFMNLAALRDIYLWDICPEGNGVKMKVGLKDFKKLRDCSRRTKCKIKIVKKKGLPFTLGRYKNRKFYSAGILIFVITLYVMSSFVWSVSVEGNDRVSSDEIIEFCKEEGLFEGQLKYKLDNKTLTQKLIAGFSDISWVAITTKGTDVTVSVVETLPEVAIEDDFQATDIVSNKACIIESISVSKGTPMVSAGDVVDVGDILVKSELIIKDGDLEVGKSYVHSKADIKGKNVIVKENSISLTYVQREYTGESKTDNKAIVGGYVLNLISPNLDGLWEKEDETEKTFKAGDTTIPFRIVTEKFLEYNDVDQQRTEDEAKALLEEIIKKQRQELEFEEIRILEEKTEFLVNNNEVKSKTIFNVIESIGTEQKITIPEEKDGTDINE